MKRLIYFLITFFAFYTASAQQVRWVPSNLVDNSCVSSSDCDRDIVCYNLEYTPSVSGYLTSYTTGFLASCSRGQTSVVFNQSCLIDDNSRTIDACNSHSKILLNCSGNTGQLKIENGTPVMLHQVCFYIHGDNKVIIEKDDVTELTMSIDTEAGQYVNDFADYRSYDAVNNAVLCDNHVDQIILSSKIDNKEIVNLQWNAIKKSENASYFLERSKNGGDFEIIAELDFSKIDSEEWNFSYADKINDPAVYNYRVQYMRLNERLYSNTVSENVGSVVHFDVYPNPSTGILHLYFNDLGESAILYIFDAQSKFILKNKIHVGVKQSIDLTDLVPGSYILKIEGDYSSAQEQLVIIR